MKTRSANKMFVSDFFFHANQEYCHVHRTNLRIGNLTTADALHKRLDFRRAQTLSVPFCADYGFRH
jgi:hypothetical protein